MMKNETVNKTLVTSLADAKSYMVEENPSLVGAYTAIIQT